MKNLDLNLDCFTYQLLKVINFFRIHFTHLPKGSEVKKKSACNAGDTGDMGLILGRDDPLEEEMATHSSILARKIPWTEDPGGLQSMESQRVRHN